MNYSIVVWGFDNDNDYYHDCDTIKAKEDAYSYINRFPNVSHVTVISVYRA